jgi:hypothetical protein
LARRGYRTTGVDRSSTMIEATLTRNGEDAAPVPHRRRARDAGRAAFRWRFLLLYVISTRRFRQSDVLRGIRAWRPVRHRRPIAIISETRETVFERGDDS